MLLRENVYDALRGAILSCELAPGQDLREHDLAERFAVSRSPVRDALLRLAGENLVTVMPRQGYRVCPVRIRDAMDLFGMRLVIEPACAAAAAADACERDLMALDPFRSGPADPSREDGFITYNRAFHAAVAALCGNRRMEVVAVDLAEQSDRLVRTSLRTLTGQDTTQLIGEHAGIIDAIQARNSATAATLMRQHLDDARARVLAGLRRTIDLSPAPGKV